MWNHNHFSRKRRIETSIYWTIITNHKFLRKNKNMKRREFLRNSVLFGTTAILPGSVLTASGSVLPPFVPATVEPLMPIWEAAVGGQWGIVKEWLRIDPSLINVTGEAPYNTEHCKHLYGNQTLLNLAVRFGTTEAMKFLIDFGADVNQNGDDNGNPLIYYAVHGCKSEVVKTLIDAGADPTARDCAGGTPLHIAVFRNLPEIVKILVEAGEDVNVVAGGNTPLHLATWCSTRTEIMKILIDSGADLMARDGCGKTPLDLADTDEKKAILREAMSNNQ